LGPRLARAVPRPVRPEDLTLYNTISEPSFSPDGSRIAFAVRRAVLEKDVYESDVYVAEPAKRRVDKFTSSGKDSDPVWSPDGSHMLFTSKRGFAEDEKGSALYVMPVGGGEAKLLVKSEERIENPQWAPDSHSVFYLTSSVRVEKDDVRVIRRLGYWFNGKGFTYNKRRHLFTVGLEGKIPTQLTRGEFEVGDFAVSHDGRGVAYLAATDDVKPYISDLMILDLKTHRRSKLTKSDMEITTLSWSPDDHAIAILGDDLPVGFASHEVLWIADVRGKRVEKVDRIDRNKANGLNSDVRAKAHGPHRVLWVRDGIYYVQADGGSVGLYRVRPGSRPVAVVGGERSVEGFDVSSEGVAFVAMDSSHLEELYLLKGRERRITSVNSATAESLDILPSVPFEFTASDGEPVEGWVLLPRRRGKVPAILYVHGGPKTAFGHAYMHEFQTLAGAGYAVIYMNPRGSDGYSEKFADIRGAYGTRDYDDLMEGLDFVLAKHKEIDGGRLGVAGGSYGGYMTNWMVGHTARFKAAVTDRSIANWISMWGVSDIGPHFTTDQMEADPWDGGEKLMADSPLTYAKNVTTPLLLVHSMEDYRCPIPEGIQFFTALKVLGKKAELVIFPGENHDLSRVGKPRHRVSRLMHYLRWFDSHLK
jgi:dipeptidyl aminopeptidase/acylaminoacyl peptidase